MHIVNMAQAKSSLSRWVKAIEQGEEREILITRNGVPVARLVPVDAMPAGQRIGVAKGKFAVPDSRTHLSLKVDAPAAPKRK